MIRNGSYKQGQGALAFVFIVGGIIVLVALALTFLVVSFLNTSSSFQSANRALILASAGAKDAILQVVRGKTGIYTYEVVSATNEAATVYVDSNTVPHQVTIESSATVNKSQRKIQVVLSVNPVTNTFDVVSWRQLTL